MKTRIITDQSIGMPETVLMEGVSPVLRCFPGFALATIRVVGPVGGRRISEAHRTWRVAYVADVPTPCDLPRRGECDECPVDSVLVELDIGGNVEARPSMGAYFGFEGVFVSAVLTSSGGLIDVRSEIANA